MIRRLRAVYENGLFRPLEPVEGLAEHTPVSLRVQDETAGDSTPLSAFAGIWTAEEADAMAALIEREFGQVDPREW